MLRINVIRPRFPSNCHLPLSLIRSGKRGLFSMMLLWSAQCLHLAFFRPPFLLFNMRDDVRSRPIADSLTLSQNWLTDSSERLNLVLFPEAPVTQRGNSGHHFFDDKFPKLIRQAIAVMFTIAYPLGVFLTVQMWSLELKQVWEVIRWRSG